MKRISFVLGAIIALFGVVSAQNEVPKQISGGVLNGKAISLPKPPFPPAAKAVGASGAVSVQVLIDENGDVISATAVSGHPLLRAAAVEAARGARFSPTKLQGMPVKVSGIITYNFVGPFTLTRIAFALSHAEKTASFAERYSSAESLASQLPADWVEEKEILNSLTFEEIVIAEPKHEEKKEAQPVPPNYADTSQTDTKNRFTVKGEANYSAFPVKGGRKLDAKSIASMQKLIGLVEARASANEAAAWSHELGVALGILVAEIEDAGKFASNLARVESLTDKAPATVNQSSLQRVKEFIESSKTGGITDESRRGVIGKAEMLSNLRY